MLDNLIDNSPLSSPLGRVVVIAALFAIAWVVARTAAAIAARVLTWHDRRQADVEELRLSEKIATLKRRETSVAIVRTSIAYVAFAIAGILSIAQVTGGVDRLATIAGGVFAILVAAFIAQRFLIDMVAGFAMFVEHWYSVGDTIVIHANQELQGVVEDLSLRRTRLRTVTGEVINVNNSSITAVRVIPSGAKELALELFVSDRADGEDLVEAVGLMVPEGPTTFIRRPWIEQIEELSPALVRVTIRATVAPGREWLAENFFPDLLKERAHDGLIVHGPVILTVDERALHSFARASAATRWNQRRLEHARDVA